MRRQGAGGSGPKALQKGMKGNSLNQEDAEMTVMCRGGVFVWCMHEQAGNYSITDNTPVLVCVQAWRCVITISACVRHEIHVFG